MTGGWLLLRIWELVEFALNTACWCGMLDPLSIVFMISLLVLLVGACDVWLILIDSLGVAYIGPYDVVWAWRDVAYWCWFLEFLCSYICDEEFSVNVSFSVEYVCSTVICIVPSLVGYVDLGASILSCRPPTPRLFSIEVAESSPAIESSMNSYRYVCCE